MLASLLGIRMTLLIGPTIVIPAPEPIIEALSDIEVTLNEAGRDGFQLTFTLGRGPTDMVDYALLSNPLLRPFNRVVIQVWMGVLPQVLMDGFITRYDVQPGNGPGTGRLVLIGEDIRVMMDLREVSMVYPGMSPDIRVRMILLKYMLYLGMPPMVMPPVPPIAPPVIEQIPAQTGTDLDYVEGLARDQNFVFYVEPAGVPMVNLAYWGLENRLGQPQPALSVNLGPDTNVNSLNFSYDGLGPSTVLGMMTETHTGLPLPVVTIGPLLVPPLAPLPAALAQQPNVRSVLPRDTGNQSYAEVFARAQASTNAEGEGITAQGELDGIQYGNLLRARRLVGVRGAGLQFDGLWYVRSVTHRIKKGEYKQSFSLKREGLGPIVPLVPP